jgi:hypothetical protein
MMIRRTVTVIVITAAAAAVAPMLAACGESERGGTAREAAVRTPAHGEPRRRPQGVVEDCSTRSLASFPRAFSDPRNVVVGPLVLDGAAHTPPNTVRDFGGNKFPVLVRAGHRVTVALSRRALRVAGLGYGPLPDGVELSRATPIGS